MGGPLATVLVARERTTSMTIETVLPIKGPSQEYTVMRFLAFLEGVGLENSDLGLRFDHAPAILDS